MSGFLSPPAFRPVFVWVEALPPGFGNGATGNAFPACRCGFPACLCKSFACFRENSACLFGLAGCYCSFPACLCKSFACFRENPACLFGLAACRCGFPACLCKSFACFRENSACLFGLAGCYCSFPACLCKSFACFRENPACLFGLAACLCGLPACFRENPACRFGLSPPAFRFVFVWAEALFPGFGGWESGLCFRCACVRPGGRLPGVSAEPGAWAGCLADGGDARGGCMARPGWPAAWPGAWDFRAIPLSMGRCGRGRACACRAGVPLRKNRRFGRAV